MSTESTIVPRQRLGANGWTDEPPADFVPGREYLDGRMRVLARKRMSLDCELDGRLYVDKPIHRVREFTFGGGNRPCGDEFVTFRKRDGRPMHVYADEPSGRRRLSRPASMGARCHDVRLRDRR